MSVSSSITEIEFQLVTEGAGATYTVFLGSDNDRSSCAGSKLTLVHLRIVRWRWRHDCHLQISELETHRCEHDMSRVTVASVPTS